VLGRVVFGLLDSYGGILVIEQNMQYILGFIGVQLAFMVKMILSLGKEI
jgi:hypothetical protein